MTETELLESLVNEYLITIEDVAFWTPYWIADPALREVKSRPLGAGPFKGKGTPGQINFMFQQSLKRMGLSRQTAEEYRWLMRQVGLGIDCSGFIYHVLNGFLRASGRNALWSHLVISRDDVLAAYDSKESWRRGVSREQVERLPAEPSLEVVCRMFKKNPRMITNVARLCDSRVNTRITRAQDVWPGDVIRMTSQWGDHAAIVTRAGRGTITYAESTEPSEGLGGVQFAHIQVTSLGSDLQEQDWDRARIYHPENGRDGVWRLNALDSRV